MQTIYPPPPLTAGFIAAYAGANPPAGWLACDGRAVKRADYPELFAAIGTAYGAGDGKTTFKLPELRARFALGVDANHPLGSMAGEYEHALTADENGPHAHGLYVRGFTGYAASNAITNAAYSYATAGASGVGDGMTTRDGSGKPHNNMPPYTVINWIISTGKDR